MLCGITPRPDQGARQRRAIAKTALGAEASVPWEHVPDTAAAAAAVVLYELLRRRRNVEGGLLKT